MITNYKYDAPSEPLIETLGWRTIEKSTSERNMTYGFQI